MPGFTVRMHSSMTMQFPSLLQPTGLPPLIISAPGTRMPFFSISAARLQISSRSTGLTVFWGLTDTKRLQAGYLLYTGMLRTSVATLLRSVDLAGVPTPVSTEYFAASADVHLVLGHITPDLYTCDTPDRKEKTREASLRRLARVVCADLDEIGTAGAEQIAEQFWAVQRDMICSQVRNDCTDPPVQRRSSLPVSVPRSFQRNLVGTDLTCELGPAADALPAFAVREVARARNIFPPGSS